MLPHDTMIVYHLVSFHVLKAKAHAWYEFKIKSV